MEPQIQYVRTSDGVSIAYYAIGQGPVTLFLILPASHLEVEWQIERLRLAYLAGAQTSTLIRLDHRGFGLSDREPDNFSVDSLVLDIEAVVDRLGLDQLRIYAWGFASIPALLYAARHPNKVTHLVQTPPATSGQDLRDDRIAKLGELMEIDPDLTLETLTRLMNPDFGDLLINEVAAELGRASIEPSEVIRFVEEAKGWDIDADAVSLSMPTLLIHQRNSKGFSEERTRRVAGLIPNSRVAFVDGVFEGAALAQRFFDEGVPESKQAASAQSGMSPEPGGLRTILFTDIVGHTEMMQRLGDERGRDVLREHERITRDMLKDHGGTEVKTMGDGFMVSFGSVTKAVECAIALQRAFAAHNDSSSEPLQVRVGLNAGEPIEEDGDLFGSTVIMASRIAAKAGAGEILIPEPLRHLLTGKSYVYADRGETMLKGFEDVVRLFEVRWQADP